MKKDEVFTQRLMQSIYRIARCRRAVFQDLLTDYGVTLHQFHLLMHMVSGKQVKVTDLSEKMLVSMPTASRMINTLCEMGLVTKNKNSSDRRSTYLELTRKGKRVVGEIRERQLAMFSGILEKMQEKDVETFLSVTERIASEWTVLLREERENGGEASTGLT